MQAARYHSGDFAVSFELLAVGVDFRRKIVVTIDVVNGAFPAFTQHGGDADYLSGARSISAHYLTARISDLSSSVRSQTDLLPRYSPSDLESALL